MFVFLRAPLVVIHAIDDPGQRSRPRLQQAFQSKSVFAGLYLLRVLAAYRSQVIGKSNGSLQKVHLAPELHLVNGEKFPGKHEQRQRVRGKDSLIADVVNGKHCARAAKYRIGFITGAQQDRHQRGLPVMTMKNIRYAQHLGSFQHGAAIEREPLGVIGIVAGGSSIERFAIEKLWIVNEVELHSGTFSAIQH